MQNLKINLVQANQYWEDKAANLSHMASLLEQITGSDLVILPEMFNTSFTMNAKALAEDPEKGAALSWLKTQAKRLDSAMYTSFIVVDAGKYYNRGYFVKPDGTFTCYDKRKLFSLAKEDEYFEAGKQSCIVEWRSWRINLQICYDLRFPELSRNRLLPDGRSRYDLSIYVANWPEKRVTHWKALLKARAIENQTYVVGVNRVGQDGLGYDYSGESMVNDGLGEQLNAENSHQELVQQVEITKAHLMQLREQLNFLKDVDN